MTRKFSSVLSVILVAFSLFFVLSRYDFMAYALNHKALRWWFNKTKGFVR